MIYLFIFKTKICSDTNMPSFSCIQCLHFQNSCKENEHNWTEVQSTADFTSSWYYITQVKHTGWLCLHSHTPTDHNRRSNSSDRKQVALSARAPPSETAGGGTPQRERWQAGWPSPPCDTGSWPCAAPASPQHCTPPANTETLQLLAAF